MSDGNRPDYGDLLRSPYDPDPEATDRREGESEIPWVPAVVAAILGALIVSIFVVYALVSRPDGGDEQVIVTSTTSTTLALEPSDSLPPGFTALNADSGVRVEYVDVSERATTLAVSSAVRGGADPADVPPVDVAYWELVSGGAPAVMTAQFGERGAIGNITIEFPALASSGEPKLFAYLAEGAQERSVMVDLPTGEVPGTLSDYRIDMGEGQVVVIDEVSIGDGWGYVVWHTEGPSPARVDTIVTFDGTDDPGTIGLTDPTQLTSTYLSNFFQGTGSLPLPPMYGFNGSFPLVRSGEPLSAANTPESISVEFHVVIPENLSEPIPVDVPTG